MTVVQSTVGRAVATEQEASLNRRGWRLDGQPAPLVLFAHGAGGTALSSYGPGTPGTRAMMRRLAEVYPVVAHDFGGSWIWGKQPDVTNRYDTVKAWGQNAAERVGASSGKIIVCGGSMGSLHSLLYAHHHPENVFCVVGTLPLVDLADMRNFDRGSQGFRESINLAHGLAAGSTGDYPTHGTSLSQLPTGTNPMAHTADYVSNGIPIQLWGATNDTLTPEARCVAFEAAVPNCDYISVGNTGGEGHSEVSIAAVNLDLMMAFVAAAVAAG